MSALQEMNELIATHSPCSFPGLQRAKASLSKSKKTESQREHKWEKTGDRGGRSHASDQRFTQEQKNAFSREL